MPKSATEFEPQTRIILASCISTSASVSWREKLRITISIIAGGAPDVILTRNTPLRGQKQTPTAQVGQLIIHCTSLNRQKTVLFYERTPSTS